MAHAFRREKSSVAFTGTYQGVDGRILAIGRRPKGMTCLSRLYRYLRASLFATPVVITCARSKVVAIIYHVVETLVFLAPLDEKRVSSRSPRPSHLRGVMPLTPFLAVWSSRI